jgi:hypothetical protein
MGFWQKFFSPLGYIGAAILALIGLSPANLTQWLASHLSPEAASWISGDRGRWAFVVISVLILGGTFRRHLARIERQSQTKYEQRPPALSSTTMSITEVAVYLRDRSAWGWRKRKELNFRAFVQDAVPDELRRVARSGEVRFIGTHPIDMQAQEINCGYWDGAIFDGDRIWDEQTEYFTLNRGTSLARTLPHLRFSRSPREDVMRMWSPASLALRLQVKGVLWLRWARYGFPAAMMEKD